VDGGPTGSRKQVSEAVSGRGKVPGVSQHYIGQTTLQHLMKEHSPPAMGMEVAAWTRRYPWAAAVARCQVRRRHLQVLGHHRLLEPAHVIRLHGPAGGWRPLPSRHLASRMAVGTECAWLESTMSPTPGPSAARTAATRSRSCSTVSRPTWGPGVGAGVELGGGGRGGARLCTNFLL
jgi:hypothetical protein